jgi:hypothetical protein
MPAIRLWAVPTRGGRPAGYIGKCGNTVTKREHRAGCYTRSHSRYTGGEGGRGRNSIGNSTVTPCNTDVLSDSCEGVDVLGVALPHGDSPRSERPAPVVPALRTATHQSRNRNARGCRRGPRGASFSLSRCFFRLSIRTPARTTDFIDVLYDFGSARGTRCVHIAMCMEPPVIIDCVRAVRFSESPWRYRSNTSRNSASLYPLGDTLRVGCTTSGRTP